MHSEKFSGAVILLLLSSHFAHTVFVLLTLVVLVLLTMFFSFRTMSSTLLVVSPVPSLVPAVKFSGWLVLLLLAGVGSFLQGLLTLADLVGSRSRWMVLATMGADVLSSLMLDGLLVSRLFRFGGVVLMLLAQMGWSASISA